MNMNSGHIVCNNMTAVRRKLGLRHFFSLPITCYAYQMHGKQPIPHSAGSFDNSRKRMDLWHLRCMQWHLCHTNINWRGTLGSKGIVDRGKSTFICTYTYIICILPGRLAFLCLVFDWLIHGQIPAIIPRRISHENSSESMMYEWCVVFHRFAGVWTSIHGLSGQLKKLTYLR